MVSLFDGVGEADEKEARDLYYRNLLYGDYVIGSRIIYLEVSIKTSAVDCHLWAVKI